MATLALITKLYSQQRQGGMNESEEGIQQQNIYVIPHAREKVRFTPRYARRS